MSKAFVRESDEEEDRSEEPQALPVGFKNYMTPEGHRQLQEELRTLLRVTRGSSRRSREQAVLMRIIGRPHNLVWADIVGQPTRGLNCVRRRTEKDTPAYP